MPRLWFYFSQTRAHEQTNLVTHFVDASFVYGSDPTTMRRLRELRGGRLKAQVAEGEEFLPNLQAGRCQLSVSVAQCRLNSLRISVLASRALGHVRGHVVASSGTSLPKIVYSDYNQK